MSDDPEQKEENLEQTFAVIIPSEASLTACIDPSIELSKLYITASKKFNQLLRQTRVIEGPDDSITVLDNPDLRWWFDQIRRIGVDIAKLTAQTVAKDTEHKIRIFEIFKNSGNFSKEQQEALITMSLESKKGKIFD